MCARACVHQDTHVHTRQSQHRAESLEERGRLGAWRRRGAGAAAVVSRLRPSRGVPDSRTDVPRVCKGRRRFRKICGPESPACVSAPRAARISREAGPAPRGGTGGLGLAAEVTVAQVNGTRRLQLASYVSPLPSYRVWGGATS